MEPQANAGKELQLVNRIYRIGQSRPVIVKKFSCVATVEERLLALRRRRNSGLLAEAPLDSADAAADPEADAMAVAVVGGTEGGGEGGTEAGAAMTVQIGDMRFVFGFEQ